MSYKAFRLKMKELSNSKVIIHLRYATRGAINQANCHPFSTNDSLLFHNGTISSLGANTRTYTSEDSTSDSLELANLLSDCIYNSITDIAPLIQNLIGDTINRLVVLESDGKCVFFNKHLGVTEDGIWYSNEYHIKPPEPKLTKVFVYGTLKQGLSNHYLLSSSKFLGSATTIQPMLMYGEGRAFPYLLGTASANQLPPSKGFKVKGEVYEVTPAVLRDLDRLEGVPTHYHSETTSVIIGSAIHPVKVYIKSIVSTSDLCQTFISDWKPVRTSSSTYSLPSTDTDEQQFLLRCKSYDFLSTSAIARLSYPEQCKAYREAYLCYYGIRPTTMPKTYEIVEELDALSEFILDEYSSLHVFEYDY